jgi:hypothetical protein
VAVSVLRARRLKRRRRRSVENVAVDEAVEVARGQVVRLHRHSHRQANRGRSNRLVPNSRRPRQPMLHRRPVTPGSDGDAGAAVGVGPGVGKADHRQRRRKNRSVIVYSFRLCVIRFQLRP